MLRVGVLAFHGDVVEHIEATKKASDKLRLDAFVTEVRTKEDLRGLDALIIPGGESTTLQKLCEREGMFPAMKKIKSIFGTCAGAILLAKKVHGRANGQRTLALMDIEVDRNAYGRQAESFEESIKTGLGPMKAVFIRAPKIMNAGKNVTVLAEHGGIIACEERADDRFYLALTFHPELSSSLFHEYFLEQSDKNRQS